MPDDFKRSKLELKILRQAYTLRSVHLIKIVWGNVCVVSLTFLSNNDQGMVTAESVPMFSNSQAVIVQLLLCRAKKAVNRYTI
jgi:hypothetical protein